MSISRSRSVHASRARWAGAIAELVTAQLPDAALVCFLDEPALVLWRNAEGPIEREEATDVLSTALAACGGVSGVHVCGEGDLRLALDAGPQIAHFDVGALDLDDADRALAIPRRRRLDRLGCDPNAPSGRRAARSRCGRHCSTCGAS